MVDRRWLSRKERNDVPTSGAYEFKLAPCALDGFAEDEMKIAPGEWAWHLQKIEEHPDFLAVYACCPDCGLLMTLWRQFGAQITGHKIDAQGNISPSVLHSYMYGDPPVEKCGFHTIPTKLLDFCDKRN